MSNSRSAGHLAGMDQLTTNELGNFSLLEELWLSGRVSLHWYGPTKCALKSYGGSFIDGNAQCSLYVTFDMFFHELCSIVIELTTLTSSGNFLLCEMMITMKSKFDKYWSKIEDINKLFIIALVLDLRYKLDYVKFCFGDLFNENKINEMTYDIKELLIKLYVFYKGVDNISNNDQVSSSIPLVNDGDVGKVDENSDFHLERIKKFKEMKEKKIFVDLKNDFERGFQAAKPYRKKGLENRGIPGEIFNITTVTSDQMHFSSSQIPPNLDEELELKETFMNSGVHVNNIEDIDESNLPTGGSKGKRV
ncbi:hypothetical protein Dsin_018827 [Dipteronia sinensis]|uniref:hAT-like transposase RNase-H fold domain-containing protein n=1 Tax=Dipteronia sinensis TaxID=43782 RepID=A0AAE0A7J4_9ROSI|nr:hypothetical protein Dsin_018827 [Dipteronia sinensis]